VLGDIEVERAGEEIMIEAHGHPFGGIRGDLGPFS